MRDGSTFVLLCGLNAFWKVSWNAELRRITVATWRGATASFVPPDKNLCRDGIAKMVHWPSMIRDPWQGLIRKVHG
jgi:hypothetical protein